MKIKHTILLLLCMLFVVACEQLEVPIAEVEMESLDIQVEATSATISFELESDATIRTVMACYSTKSNRSDEIRKYMSKSDGKYVVTLSNLQSNTKYYLRYQVSNAYSSIYVNKIDNFTTPKEEALPIVTTSVVTQITETTAVAGGNVTSDGGAEVTERGIVYSTNQNPTISNIYNTIRPCGSGTGSFTYDITGLQPNTTYYVRAYATNDKGTAYGEQVTFTTNNQVVLPSVTTAAITQITETTAVAGGNVTSDGNASVTERGVVYSTNQNPTISNIYNTIRPCGSGTGSFTYDITGLQPNTTYYLRAYATNDKGTAYGEQVSFTTEEEGVIASESVEVTVNGVSFNMIQVEGGTFTMGATSEQGSDAEDDEKPTHSVTLSDYYIGETEVTQELWQAVMGNNPSSFEGSNLPVEQVSWEDCQTFITKLNQLTGKTFRLPTEAEWEYAARGGKKSKGYKYAGSNTLNDVAWYMDNSSSTTHPVKQKQANELGLYDMSGNVWEWCQDWCGDYSSSAQTNPTGPSSGSRRVYRGGSWYSSASRCRVANRSYYSPGDRYYYLGFRVVLLP